MRKIESSTIEKPKTVLKEKSNRKKHFWLISFAVIALFALVFAALKYRQTIKIDEKGSIIGISEAQKEKFLADSLKMTKCVQYALLVIDDGFYAHCGTTLKIFLKKGEVWKYGVTCEENPESRYSEKFYLQQKLIFIPEFYGSKWLCEIEERKKLYAYPVLPENITRKAAFRLVLPPGNCQTR